MKRKILSIALILSMVVCLAGCGNKRESQASNAPEGSSVAAVTANPDKTEGNAADLGIEEEKGATGTVGQWAQVGAILPLRIHNQWGTAVNKVWMSGSNDSSYYLLGNSSIGANGTIDTYTNVYGGNTSYDMSVEFANGDDVHFTLDLTNNSISGVEIWLSGNEKNEDVISWCDL